MTFYYMHQNLMSLTCYKGLNVCFCLQRLEQEIEELEPSYRVGSVVVMTDSLKLSLITEIKTWQQAFAKALNQKSAQEMNEILDFFDNMMKRLYRPLKDLDDVRAHMAALNEIREAEVRIDMTISPIEEAYAMLNKYNLVFNDGNAERVDSLTYGYFKLKTRVSIHFGLTVSLF